MREGIDSYWYPRYGIFAGYNIPLPSCSLWGVRHNGSVVQIESAVAPECAGDGIEDRRLGARDTAPQTEHLGESTP